MTENTRPVPASPQLFRMCADHLDSDEYWSLFVNRFNPLLARSVAVAWRKFGRGDWPPADVADDLLQDIYTTILKNDARLLRNFQGTTEAEAQSYLAQTAINQTLTYLRSRATRKRSADEISLQALIEDREEFRLPNSIDNPLKRLAQREFLEIIRRLFTGANAERDILIFLLYLYDGYSVAEITRMKLCDLKETSIANLLAQMKSRLKKYLSGDL
jgi:RNA polymerase sigma factor (sigma-70 family)